MSIATAEMPLQQTGVQYGGFWIRLVAYIIDCIILGIVSSILGSLLGAFSPANDPMATFEEVMNIMSLVGLVYMIVLPPKLGGTIGKLALGYHIVGKDGRHIGYGKAIVRYIAQIVSALAIALGYIWIGFDSRKQGWHDKIAGTYVVKKEFVQA